MRHAAIYFIALASIALGHPSAAAEIAWEPKLREAHAKAKESGRLLLLHFYTDNCVYCDRLEAGAFQNQMVTETINQKFVAVKVHGAKNKKLTEMFKVSKYPTDVIVTTDGKALSHSVSPQQPQRYMDMLAKANSLYTPQRTIDQRTISQDAMIAEQTPAAAPLSGTNGYRSATPNPYALPPTTDATEPGIASTSVAPNGMALPTAAGKPDVAAPAGTLSTGNVAASNSKADGFGPGQLPVQVPTPGNAVASQTLGMPAVGTTRENQFMVPSAKTNAGAAGVNASLAGVRSNGMTLAAPNKSSAGSTDDAAAEPEIAELPELAIQGYCAVSVVNQGAWIEGNPDFGVVHLGKLYLFANQSAMEQFLSDPMPFTPMLNEIDVVRFFEEKRIVPGKREWGVIDPVHNRMFFFSDEAAMLHFEEQFDRYLDASINVMDEAIKQSNPGV